MTRPVYIYVIEDPNLPEEKSCRYVGKSVRPDTRFKEHIYYASKNEQKTRVYNGIRKLLREGVEPRFKIIEEHETNTLAKLAEIKWIAEMRARGCDLWNLTEGGDGNLGWQPTQETRNRMAEVKREKYLGDGNPFFGKTHSDETKDKISRAKKSSTLPHPFLGRKHSQNTKQKQADAKKGMYEGTKNPNVKLSERDVLEIRELATRGWRGSDIAAKFNVSRTLVYDILNGKAWKCLK